MALQIVYRSNCVLCYSGTISVICIQRLFQAHILNMQLYPLQPVYSNIMKSSDKLERWVIQSVTENLLLTPH